MTMVKLDGVEVFVSGLTQRSFRAASCDFLLPVTPQNKDEAIKEFAKVGELGKYSGLRISGPVDLGFLKDFPDLLYLEIVDQKKADATALAGLENLRGLKIDSPGNGLDFAWFPLLEVFVGDWHPDNRNMQHCRELRQLRTWGFKPKAKDLSELANIVRLERLHLTKTNIASLAGVEMLEDLRYLAIAYAPDLESLAALSLGELQLRELEIANAKKIGSYLPIAACRWLRNLKLSACAPLADLQWLAPLERLEFLSFVDTDVTNGDLTPLLKLPALRYAGSMNKKHYNPRIDDLNKQLEQRTKP